MIGNFTCRICINYDMKPFSSCIVYSLYHSFMAHAVQNQEHICTLYATCICVVAMLGRGVSYLLAYVWKGILHLTAQLLVVQMICVARSETLPRWSCYKQHCCINSYQRATILLQHSSVHWPTPPATFYSSGVFNKFQFKGRWTWLLPPNSCYNVHKLQIKYSCFMSVKIETWKFVVDWSRINSNFVC